MKYEFEWQYVDDPTPRDEFEPYIHFDFMLRFPDVPPGNGHVAHFCFNVLQMPVSRGPGISVVRRGFLASVPFSKTEVQAFVEALVAKAFENPRDEALLRLNTQVIHWDLDFSDEFADDLLETDKLLELIETAFNGVELGEGITLHQAVVIDDYGSEEEFEAARKLDRQGPWQSVPNSDIATNTSIFSFLDPQGFRYYLPAYMSWAIKNHANDVNDTSFFTYLAVLPTVAPRESGRGLGEAFDLAGFIEQRSLDQAQVNAIFRFICFMAIKAEQGMDEDHYAAAKKWRSAALD